MGIISEYGRGKGSSIKTAQPAEYDPTLFERIVSPLSVLERPQVAATHLLTGSPIEALKAAIPFVPYDKYYPSDALGVENPWVAAGVNMFADPMNFAAIGKLTAAGKIRKSLQAETSVVKALEKLEEVQKGVQSVENIATVEKMLAKSGFKAKIPATAEALTESLAVERAKETELLAQLSKLPKDMPNRNALTVGIPFTGIEKGFGKFPSRNEGGVIRNIFTDRPEKAALQTDKLKLTEKIEKLEATAKPENLQKLIEHKFALEEVGQELQKFGDPILRVPFANKIASVTKWIGDHFDGASQNSVVQSLREITAAQLNAKTGEMDAKIGEFLNKFATYAEETGSADKALERIRELAEYRQVVDPANYPDLQTTLNRGMESIRDKFGKKIEKAEKFGRFEKVEKLKTQLDERLSALKLDAEKTRIHHTEMAKRLGTVTTDELEMVRLFGDSYDEMLTNLRLHGVEVDPILSSKGRTTYVHRIWSDKALALKSKNPTLYSAINRELNPRFRPAMERKLKPELDLLEVNEYLRKRFDIDFDFYDTNVIKGMLDYRDQYIRKINTANYGMAVASHFGTKTPAGVPVLKFLEKLGIKPNNTAELGELRMPRYIADDAFRAEKMLKMQQKFEESHPLISGTLQWLDAVPNKLARMMYTSSALMPDTAFTTTNMIGNTFNSALGGITLPVHLPKAMKIMWKHANKAELTAEEANLFKLFVGHKGLRTGQMRDYEGLADLVGREPTNAIDRFYEKLTTKGLDKLASVTEKIGGRQVVNAMGMPGVGRKFNGFMEDASRFAHFMGRMKKGDTPIQAMRSMNKYLFDYTSLTPFEQRVMRPTFLFYTWIRKNLPLQIKTMINDPRIMRVYQHVTQMGDDDRPDYLRTGTSIPVPGSPNEYIGSLRLPIEDMMLTNVGAVAPFTSEQIAEIGRNIASRLSPVIKAGVAYTTGKEPYTGKPTKDLSMLEHMNLLLPTGKLVRKIKVATDDEKAASRRWFDILLGMKTYKTTPGRAALDEKKRRLLREGKVSTFPVLTPERGLTPEEEKIVRSQISDYQKQVAKNRKNK